MTSSVMKEYGTTMYVTKEVELNEYEKKNGRKIPKYWYAGHDLWDAKEKHANENNSVQ